jgi:hypothetical protein
MRAEGIVRQMLDGQSGKFGYSASFLWLDDGAETL